MTEEVRPLRKYLTTAALVVAMLLPGTAHGFQTGVDSQEVHYKRRAAVQRQEWLERVERRKARERREAAQEAAAAEAAAQAEAAAEPSYPSGGSAGALSADAVASLARGAGFPENLISTMVAIAYRESTYCPTAVNGYGCAGVGHAVPGGPACGLWQMYPCPGPHALDPATNAAMAYAKYVGAGHSLSPWGY